MDSAQIAQRRVRPCRPRAGSLKWRFRGQPLRGWSGPQSTSRRNGSPAWGTAAPRKPPYNGWVSPSRLQEVLPCSPTPHRRRGVLTRLGSGNGSPLACWTWPSTWPGTPSSPPTLPTEISPPSGALARRNTDQTPPGLPGREFDLGRQFAGRRGGPQLVGDPGVEVRVRGR